MSKMLGKSTAKGFNSTNMERVELYNDMITLNSTDIGMELDAGNTYIFNVELEAGVYTCTFVVSITGIAFIESPAVKILLPIENDEVIDAWLWLECAPLLKKITIKASGTNSNASIQAKISYVVLC